MAIDARSASGGRRGLMLILSSPSGAGKTSLVRELLARVHALLRRAQPAGNGNGDTAFSIGAATIDPKTFQLRRGKTVEELTAKELKLLQLFHALGVLDPGGAHLLELLRLQLVDLGRDDQEGDAGLTHAEQQHAVHLLGLTSNVDE